MIGRDEYSNRRETTPEERIAELMAANQAADCAEYASREDFIEQVIPKLDTYSVPHLWVLSALLCDRADSWLGKFVAFFARKVEAAVARAIAAGEITEHRPHDKKATRWYIPSPTLLWGEWRAQQAHSCGWREGWKQCESHHDDKSIKPAKATLPINILRDWKPMASS